MNIKYKSDEFNAGIFCAVPSILHRLLILTRFSDLFQFYKLFQQNRLNLLHADKIEA